MAPRAKKAAAAAQPTNLLDAIRVRDLDAIRRFVAEGASLTPASGSYTTAPLEYAAQSASDANDAEVIPVVELLVELGADVNFRASPYNAPPLFWAAYVGHDALSRWLVDHGARIEGHDGADEHTMLHCATEGGLLWLVDRCIDAGIDPNAATTQGHRAAHYAVTRDRVDTRSKDWRALLERLRAAGADLTVNNANWGTPLHWAAMHGRADAARYLVREAAIAIDVVSDDPDGRTALLDAAMNDADASMVKTMLELGANPRFATAATGRTALHFAAWGKAHAAAVQALLEAGADRGAKTRAPCRFASTSFKAGVRPVDVAKRAKATELAALLA